MKRSFKEFQEIIKRYHLPVDLKNVIHVAGTNGKGSTVTFIKDLLVKQGYHVGTFTSPYIIKHNERISVDGKPIPDEELLRLVNDLYPIIEKEHFSMFEIDTIIMLNYFHELDLDYHVIECGIGGLNDKTNVIQSQVAVISNIGYDHQFMLGDTLLEIARHKVGIIKPNKPCFTTEKNKEIVDIFKCVCKINDSKLYVCDVGSINYPYVFNCLSNEYVLKAGGSYQVKNAILAINVCNYLIDLDKELVQQAIDCFNWPGRFEKFGSIYLDGAHNVDGILALKKTIKDQKLENIVIVFSALNDKDVCKMKRLVERVP